MAMDIRTLAVRSSSASSSAAAAAAALLVRNSASYPPLKEWQASSHYPAIHDGGRERRVWPSL